MSWQDFKRTLGQRPTNGRTPPADAVSPAEAEAILSGSPSDEDGAMLQWLQQSLDAGAAAIWSILSGEVTNASFLSDLIPDFIDEALRKLGDIRSPAFFVTHSWRADGCVYFTIWARVGSQAKRMIKHDPTSLGVGVFSGDTGQWVLTAISLGEVDDVGTRASLDARAPESVLMGTMTFNRPGVALPVVGKGG